MTKHDHTHRHCLHARVKYCASCQKPYCQDCGQEWGAYTFTWPYYQHQQTYPIGPYYSGLTSRKDATTGYLYTDGSGATLTTTCAHN